MCSSLTLTSFRSGRLDSNLEFSDSTEFCWTMVVRDGSHTDVDTMIQEERHPHHERP